MLPSCSPNAVYLRINFKYQNAQGVGEERDMMKVSCDERRFMP